MKNTITIVAFFILILNTGVVSASDASKSAAYNYWFELGLIGRSFSREFEGNGMVQKISVSKNNNIISIRNLDLNNGAGFLECAGRALLLSTCRGSTIEIMDQALLLGRRLDNKDLSFSIGVGRVDASYDEIPNKNYSIYGVALDMDWVLVESRWLGLSVNVSGNLNNKNTMLGAYFTFMLGKLMK